MLGATGEDQSDHGVGDESVGGVGDSRISGCAGVE